MRTRKFKKAVSLILALCMVATMLPTIPAKATDYMPVNLIQNGDFESATEGVPSAWSIYQQYTGGTAPTAKAGGATSGSNYYLSVCGNGGNLVSVRSSFFPVTAGDELLVTYSVKTGNTAYTHNIAGFTSGSTSTVLESGIVAATTWGEISKTFTVAESCDTYAIAFQVASSDWANLIDFDNVRVYKVDADYVVYMINEAVQSEDETALGEWLYHAKSGLTGVDSQKMAKYLSALSIAKTDKGSNLTTAEILTVIEGVNDGSLYTPVNLIQNGDFENGTDGWVLYNANAGGTMPSVVSDDTTYEGQSYMKMAYYGDNLLSIRSSYFSVEEGDEILVQYAARTGNQWWPYNIVQFKEDNSQTVLAQDVFAATTWTEDSKTFTMTESGNIAIAFQTKVNTWTLSADFDDVRIYKVDADYVTYMLNDAIQEEDQTEFGEWLGHAKSGLTDVNSQKTAQYLSALSAARTEKGKNLTTAEMQSVIAEVNDNLNYVPVNLIQNGNFESGTDGWTVYNANAGGTMPSVVSDDTTYEGQSYMKMAYYGDNLLSIRSSYFSVEEGDEILVQYAARTGNEWWPYNIVQFKEDNSQTVLAQDVFAATTWTVDSKTFTMTESGNIAIAFQTKVNTWSLSADFDDVRIYKVDADYVRYMINAAIAEEDQAALGKWMSHAKSGLTNVDSQKTAQYLNALITARTEKGKNLTVAEIQTAVDGVNSGTIYILTNLVSNGSFEKVTGDMANGWTKYNSWSANPWPKVIYDSSVATDGEYYMQTAPAGAGGTSGIGTPIFNVNKGDVLIVKYDAKGNAAAPYQLRGSGTPSESQSDYDVLEDNLTVTDKWQEKSHIITISEDTTEYALSFYYNKVNAWGDTGYILDIDNVRVYKLDGDYVALEINDTLTNNDNITFRTWIAHSCANLTGYDKNYAMEYFHALLAEKNEKGRNLTHAEIQAVLHAVNTTRALGADETETEVDATDAGLDARSNKISAVPGELYYVEAMASGTAAGVEIVFEQWTDSAAAEPGKRNGEVCAITSTSSRIATTFSVNIDYSCFTISFAKEGEGDVAVSDIKVYKVNKALALRNINIAIEEENQDFFEEWATHAVSGLEKIKDYNLARYMTELKTAREAKGSVLTYAEIQEIVDAINWEHKNYETTDIGTQLELFVEDSLIDTDETTAELEQKLPTEKDIVIDHNAAWENFTSVYHTIFKDGDIYRMYYRGIDDNSGYNTICYAESKDGVNWTKPELNICEFNGSTANNIIFDYNSSNTEEYAQRVIECFFAFKDTNPNVKAGEEYKGILTVRGNWSLPAKEGDGNIVYAFKSSDGIHWTVMNDGKRVFDGCTGHGSLDSHNVAYWNEAKQTYVMFFRENFEGTDDGYTGGLLRTTSTLTSDDFCTWDSIKNSTKLEYDFVQLQSEADGYLGSISGNYQQYVNGISTYDRAPHIYIGTPTRYLNDAHEVAPYLIASRDGEVFKWWDQMLIKPEGERAGNRSNYAMWGLNRTSDTEYSLYASEGWANNYSKLRQFTFRVDGFIAAKGDDSGNQTLLTKPIKFAGEHLILNYKAATGGSVVARLVDISGNVIEGFNYNDCTALTGDSIAAELKWTGNLAAVKGQAVKIQFKLTDAELYSYQFVGGTPIEFEKVSAETITGVESIRLHWEEAEYALSYKITVAENAAFTTGVTTYTSVANFVDVTGLDASKEYYWNVEAIGAEGSTMIFDTKLWGHTVTLDGKLGVNSFWYLSDVVKNDADAFIRFTQGESQTDIPLTQAIQTSNGEKFTYEIAAKEMADTITAQIFSGVEAISEAYTYSVKEYADSIIAGTYADKSKTLAKAMLNYGAYTQTYFGYNIGSLANSVLESTDKDVSSVSAETLNSFASSEAAASQASIGTLAGSSLILESETTLKMYFTLSAQVSLLTATANTASAALVPSGNYYYVAVENIAAQDLDENHTVTITDGTNTLSATYNVMTYCYNVLSRDSSANRTAELKDVARAMYLYNQAANAYVEGGQ